MIELKFHRELYDGFAVDEAVKAYAEYATAELEEQPGGFVVRLAATPVAAEHGFDEATIAAELGNYALGKTIERAQQAPGGGGA